MKHFNLKTSFYIKKFGIGVSIDKLPIVDPFMYKITVQIGWIECCLSLILKSNTWNR